MLVWSHCFLNPCPLDIHQTGMSTGDRIHTGPSMSLLNFYGTGPTTEEDDTGKCLTLFQGWSKTTGHFVGWPIASWILQDCPSSPDFPRAHILASAKFLFSRGCLCLWSRSGCPLLAAVPLLPGSTLSFTTQQHPPMFPFRPRCGKRETLSFWFLSGTGKELSASSWEHQRRPQAPSLFPSCPGIPACFPTSLV